MSQKGGAERKSQNSRKSIVRRITAHQVGDQISLLIFFDALVLLSLVFFIICRLFATSVEIIAINIIETYGADGTGEKSAADRTIGAGGISVTYSVDRVGEKSAAGRVAGTGGINAANGVEGTGVISAADRITGISGVNAESDYDGIIDAGGVQGIPNILYDRYALEKNAEPRGFRLDNPVAALFGAPDGAYIDIKLTRISDINPFNQWANIQTYIALPNETGTYDIIWFTHNYLFFILFRAFSVLLFIQAFIIFRNMFHIRTHARRTLRPITELTLAAQSINAAQAATATPVNMGASASYGKREQNSPDKSVEYRVQPGAESGAHAGLNLNTDNRANDVGERNPRSRNAGYAAYGESSLKISGAIDTLNTITERHLDRRIAIDDERVELKGLASAINGMLDRLDAAYQAQLRFVSDASHELRTPISVIQGYANLLDRWGKNDEKTLQESIDAIKNEAQSMKELVEQLLFLARGDNHSIMFTTEDVDISALVEEVTREAKMIDETHIYQARIDGKLIIRGDYQLLKQALRILIDNSVKFTPSAGRITIGATRSETRPGYVDITVRDSGSGISEEALPHVFDRFYKADESRSRSTGGTGLGLSIAKWIVDSHDGIIEVVSRQDAGTRFTLSFRENPRVIETADTVGATGAVHSAG